MKKLFFASVVASLALTGQAYAGGTGTLTGSGQVSTTQCTWINSNVSVSLSNGVVAAYDCATSATNVIYVGTASQRGTTKTRTMQCAVTATDAGTDTTTCNNSSCTSTPPSDAAGATCDGTFEVTGNTLFSASTNGGSVAAGAVGKTCDPDPAKAGDCASAVLGALTAMAQ